MLLAQNPDGFTSNRTPQLNHGKHCFNVCKDWPLCTDQPPFLVGIPMFSILQNKRKKTQVLPIIEAWHQIGINLLFAECNSSGLNWVARMSGSDKYSELLLLTSCVSLSFCCHFPFARTNGKIENVPRGMMH